MAHQLIPPTQSPLRPRTTLRGVFLMCITIIGLSTIHFAWLAPHARANTITEPDDLATTQSSLSLKRAFSSSMVLQRDQPITISGYGPNRLTLTVSLAGNIVSTRVDSAGRWTVTLPSLPAGGPYTLSVTGSTNTIQLTDIFLGDVYVCSGQSNMAFPLYQMKDGSAQIARIISENLQLKLLKMPLNPYFAKQTSPYPSFQWTNATADKLKYFSAICALVGERLSKNLNLPIGLIATAAPGSPIEAWTSPANMASYGNATSLLQSLSQASSVETIFPPDARACEDYGNTNVLYRGMIAPLSFNAIKAVIWYQGESNHNRAYEYQLLLPRMVKTFRDQFNDAHLPFFVVQLPEFGGAQHWEEIRSAQQDLAKTTSSIYVIPTLDLGDPALLHPIDKLPFARRVSTAIFAHLYGLNITATGPTYVSNSISGAKVKVTFTGTDGGLVARPGQPLGGFTLAGSDGIFYPAIATITSSSTVSLTAPQVPHPLYVRYAWSQETLGATLANGNGWPAFPFRTDTKPFVTKNASLANRPLCPSGSNIQNDDELIP